MMLESKTLKFWMVIFAIGFVAVFLSALLAHYLGVEVPLISEFLGLLGVGGGGATARNVVADHAAPAWQRAQEAKAASSGGYQIPSSLRGGTQ